ncbi:MAG TPA: hypothetical protein VMH61_01710 [Candidatus Acidoferrales bacterium]|nr:hypothetical protein [Candidatus Acidoferrales bacterium]
MKSARTRAVACSLLLAAALAVSPAVHAGTAEPDGTGKLEKYAGCAAGLALSQTIPAAIAAFLVCVKVLVDELP